MSLLTLILIINCFVFSVASNECPLFIYSCDNKIYSSLLESNNTFTLYNITVNEGVGGFKEMDYSLNKNFIIYKSFKYSKNFYITSIDSKFNDEELFISGNPYAAEIAIDWIHDLIYFSHYFDLQVMNISNKRMRAIILYDELFTDIAVNPLESFIIWATNKPNGTIIKANQDGSDRKVLYESDLHNLYSIAIEFETKRIYFTDSNLKHISSMDFNGNHRRLIYELINYNTYEIQSRNLILYNFEIYGRNIFLYNYTNKEFIKISTDGVIENTAKIEEHSYCRVTKIIHYSRQPKGENK